MILIVSPSKGANRFHGQLTLMPKIMRHALIYIRLDYIHFVLKYLKHSNTERRKKKTFNQHSDCRSTFPVNFRSSYAAMMHFSTAEIMQL